MDSNHFLAELDKLSNADYLYEPEENTRIGVKMGEVFKLAKECVAMPLDEVEKLLKHDVHEARVGAVSILDFIARDSSISDEKRKAMYDMYIDNHEYINTWDLVDRAAPYVVGGYLFNRSRELLYKLANSDQPMERRTAMVATYYFIRQDEIDDTFEIAHILADDPEKFVQTAVGSWLREAGKRDKSRLMTFLVDHKNKLSSKALSYAMEKLSKEEKDFIRSK